MYLFLLVFPLLLPTIKSACINCGGADKTSAKRLKMPNKSVFTRLAGIELMEIFEITNQNNHEVCAQQCDAHAECAVFEFNLPNKLCVLASEYARLSDDLAKGAFETIVFVKVRGKFTKALPKEKETCLDKSEYEDYVKHEVDKWLNPSPKKSSSTLSTSSSDHLPNTEPEAAQTSGSTSSVSSPTTTTTGTTSGGTSSITSEGERSTGGGGSTGYGSGSTEKGVMSEEDLQTSQDPIVTAAGTSTQPMQSSSGPTSTPAKTTIAASTATPTYMPTPSTDPTISQSSTTVTKKDPIEGEGEGTTQSTSNTYEGTPREGETTPEQQAEGSSSSTVDPLTTTSGEAPTTSEHDNKGNGGQIEGGAPLGKWRIKSQDKYLHAFSDRVYMDGKLNGFSVWSIQDNNGKVTIKSSQAPPGFLTSATSDSVKLFKDPNNASEFSAIKNSDSSYSFLSIHGTWLSAASNAQVSLTMTNGASEKFHLSEVPA